MKHFASIAVLSILASPLLPPHALAQKMSGPSTKPPREPGTLVHPPRRAPVLLGNISVGDPAPSFVLDSVDGRSIRLGSLRGDWLVIAFADRWQQVADLKRIEKPMSEIGAKVLAICHEKSRTLSSRSVKQAIPAMTLADVTGQVSAAYGLYDPERSETLPGVVILDRKGVVRLAIVTLERIPPPESIAQLAQFVIRGH